VKANRAKSVNQEKAIPEESENGGGGNADGGPRLKAIRGKQIRNWCTELR